VDDADLAALKGASPGVPLDGTITGHGTLRSDGLISEAPSQQAQEHFGSSGR
jgi:hypothetical protein